MLSRWFATVPGTSVSRAAISSLVRPSATRAATSWDLVLDQLPQWGGRETAALPRRRVRKGSDEIFDECPVHIASRSLCNRRCSTVAIPCPPHNTRVLKQLNFQSAIAALPEHCPLIVRWTDVGMFGRQRGYSRLGLSDARVDELRECISGFDLFCPIANRRGPQFRFIRLDPVGILFEISESVLEVA